MTFLLTYVYVLLNVDVEVQKKEKKRLLRKKLKHFSQKNSAPTNSIPAISKFTQQHLTNNTTQTFDDNQTP